ncbi:MAG: hypothetical protein O7A04_06750 [Acidobacteria bacterium]|nr:hypothetical protein [Acidobacteriota bacterium]
MDEPKSIAEQHQQWCVHYQRDPAKMFGKGDERCKAGVSYDDLARVGELGRAGCMLRLPCIRRHHTEVERRGQPLCECSFLLWPTAEESAEHEREAAADIARILLVVPILEEIRLDHKGEEWSGEVPCPACSTALRLTHAAINGHIHGRCGTPGCISFVE